MVCWLVDVLFCSLRQAQGAKFLRHKARALSLLKRDDLFDVLMCWFAV